MTNGEWLLESHTTHKSLYQTTKKRYDQLLGDLGDGNEVIEAMSLTRPPIGQFQYTAHSGAQSSPTEHIALTYEEALAKQQREAEEKLSALRQRLTLLDAYIKIFATIMAGLNDMEAWLVTEHYLNGNSIRFLSYEKAPNGMSYPKTTLQRRKKQLIAKVNLLILQTYGDFEQREAV